MEGVFIMGKKCIKCGVEKPNTLDFFRKSSGDKLRNGCKGCEKKYNSKYRNENQEKIKEHNKGYKKQYYEKNREQLIEEKKKYYEDNKEAITVYKKQYHEKNKEEINKIRNEKYRLEHPLEIIPSGMKKCSACKMIKPATSDNFSKNKRKKDGLGHRCKQCRREAEYWSDVEKAKSKQKAYYEENKEKINVQTTNYTARKYKEDLNFRLLTICRSRVTMALKGKIKSKCTLELIGGSVENLKKHLESQFTEGMSWENHGKWHIDHIRPCASFDFTDKEQQNECFHYTNLQPLWAKDNMSKSAKYKVPN